MIEGLVSGSWQQREASGTVAAWDTEGREGVGSREGWP